MNANAWILELHADYQRRIEQVISDRLKAVDPMPSKLDPVVEANRALLHQRSQVGIAKYGVTLDGARLSERELIVHALQEALDLANYLQEQLQRVDREAAMRADIAAKFGGNAAKGVE